MFIITMEIHRYCIPSHLPATDTSSYSNTSQVTSWSAVNPAKF